jgi:hypothetical protein
MRKTTSRFLLSVAVLLAATCLSVVTGGSAPTSSAYACLDCSDPWGGCKEEVKVKGHVGDCWTFACEVGTDNEHLIKTNDKTGVGTLKARAHYDDDTNTEVHDNVTATQANVDAQVQSNTSPQPTRRRARRARRSRRRSGM